MKNLIIPFFLAVLVFAIGVRVVSAETTTAPTVSPNRICDLDKAAGSGITITNTSTTNTSTAFTLFYNNSHGYSGLQNPSLAPGEVKIYQPLPSILAANFTGWALVNIQLGAFKVSAQSPAVMHALDFSVAIPGNLNLVFLTPEITGENCYNKFSVDWGDGSVIEVHDKGGGPLFHAYPNVTQTYNVTVTSRLNSADIISHTDQVAIVITTPTAVTVNASEALASTPRVLLIAILLLVATISVSYCNFRSLAGLKR